jgi:hypothetical protein
MAKLMLVGEVAHVELTTDPEDGQVVARCRLHSRYRPDGGGRGRCPWTERYDDLGDAAKYAADHADTGRR